MAYVFGSMFVCDTLQNAKKVHTRPSLIPRPRGRREHGLGTRLIHVLAELIKLEMTSVCDNITTRKYVIKFHS